MSDQTVKDTKNKMAQSVEAFAGELSSIRTGRATPSLVENLPVEAYGSSMKLMEVASITSPDPSSLLIQPWDSSVIGSIANAIRISDLNLNPVVDGTSIRLPIPPLTTERRQEFVKIVHKKAEEARVAIRSQRHDALSELKRYKDEGELSQDEQLGFEKRIQETVEDANRQIESMASHKEGEVLKL